MNRYTTDRGFNEALKQAKGNIYSVYKFGFILIILGGCVKLFEIMYNNEHKYDQIDMSGWILFCLGIGFVLIVIGMYTCRHALNELSYSTAGLSNSYLVIEDEFVRGSAQVIPGSSASFDIPYTDITSCYSRTIDVSNQNFVTLIISTKDCTYYFAVDNANDAEYVIRKKLSEVKGKAKNTPNE